MTRKLTPKVTRHKTEEAPMTDEVSNTPREPMAVMSEFTPPG